MLGSLSLFMLGHLQAVCEGIHLIICFNSCICMVESRDPLVLTPSLMPAGS